MLVAQASRAALSTHSILAARRASSGNVRDAPGGNSPFSTSLRWRASPASSDLGIDSPLLRPGALIGLKTLVRRKSRLSCRQRADCPVASGERRRHFLLVTQTNPSTSRPPRALQDA